MEYSSPSRIEDPEQPAHRVVTKKSRYLNQNLPKTSTYNARSNPVAPHQTSAAIMDRLNELENERVQFMEVNPAY